MLGMNVHTLNMASSGLVMRFLITLLRRFQITKVRAIITPVIRFKVITWKTKFHDKRTDKK